MEMAKRSFETIEQNRNHENQKCINKP